MKGQGPFYSSPEGVLAGINQIIWERRIALFTLIVGLVLGIGLPFWIDFGGLAIQLTFSVATVLASIWLSRRIGGPRLIRRMYRSWLREREP